jgi:hypothetical protein
MYIISEYIYIFFFKLKTQNISKNTLSNRTPHAWINYVPFVIPIKKKLKLISWLSRKLKRARYIPSISHNEYKFLTNSFFLKKKEKKKEKIILVPLIDEES